MVTVPELARGKGLELGVVLGVRGRQDHGAWPCEAEHDPLEGSEARWIEVEAKHKELAIEKLRAEWLEEGAPA